MKKLSPPVRKGTPRDPAKERLWRGMLKRFAAGGQSVRAFCAARGLKETAFYFWRSEIQRRDGHCLARGPRRAASRTGTTSQARSHRPVAFAEVLVRPPQSPVPAEGLRLILSHGRELILPALMAMEQVARLVVAIEAASASTEGAA